MAVAFTSKAWVVAEPQVASGILACVSLESRCSAILVFTEHGHSRASGQSVFQLVLSYLSWLVLV